MIEAPIYRDIAIIMVTSFALTFIIGLVVDVRTRLKQGEKLFSILRSYL